MTLVYDDGNFHAHRLFSEFGNMLSTALIFFTITINNVLDNVWYTNFFG